MVEKDGKESMRNKLKGRELYLLKHNPILGNKTKQNDLQELQGGSKRTSINLNPKMNHSR